VKDECRASSLSNYILRYTGLDARTKRTMGKYPQYTAVNQEPDPESHRIRLPREVVLNMRRMAWGSQERHATAPHHHQHPTSILTVGTSVRTAWSVRCVLYVAVVLLHTQLYASPPVPLPLLLLLPVTSKCYRYHSHISRYRMYIHTIWTYQLTSHIHTSTHHHMHRTFSHHHSPFPLFLAPCPRGFARPWSPAVGPVVLSLLTFSREVKGDADMGFEHFAPQRSSCPNRAPFASRWARSRGPG
jgi:hypothetical protein